MLSKKSKESQFFFKGDEEVMKVEGDKNIKDALSEAKTYVSDIERELEKEKQHYYSLLMEMEKYVNNYH